MENVDNKAIDQYLEKVREDDPQANQFNVDLHPDRKAIPKEPIDFDYREKLLSLYNMCSFNRNTYMHTQSKKKLRGKNKEESPDISQEML